MAFEYQLEAVLRLQRSIEKQEENRLLACAAQVAALRKEIEDWEEQRLQRKRMSSEDLRAGSTGAALGVAVDWDASARKKQAQIAVRLIQAEEARRKQVEKVQAERQKREVLEGLRERLERAYDLEELRRVQQVMDDMHLTRAFFWKG